MVRSVKTGLVILGIVLALSPLEVVGNDDWPNYELSLNNEDDVPSLISPAWDSVIGGSLVTFEWTPVEGSGIAGYVLVYMMGTKIYPGNPSRWAKGSYKEIIIFGKTTSSYSMSLQGNTQQKPVYWWSIATVSSSGQKEEFPSPFRFSVDNTPPNISEVELVQPVDATLSTRIPTFSWKVPQAVYEDVDSWTLEYAKGIQLVEDRNSILLWNNSLPFIPLDGHVSISYTLPSYKALSNGIWYWHISATDGAGNTSDFTLLRKFVVNAEEEPSVKLVSPPNGFESDSARPTFSWLQMQGATAYHLQVDNSSNFSSPEIDQDGITTTIYMATSNLESDTYYWRVTCDAPNVEWSDVWSFTILGETPQRVIVTSPGSEAPEQVVLETPWDGVENISPTPLFKWEALEGATTYTLEVSTNDLFTSFVVKKTDLTTTYWGTIPDWESNEPSWLDEGKYYWRVSSDLPNSTSSTWNFTVKNPLKKEKPSLSVIVFNIHGNPILGATITLKKDETTIVEGNTDTSGKAVFNDLEKGTYTLEVAAKAYGAYYETLNISTHVIRNITLYRGTIIHGFVYYDNIQNPATNVEVTVYDTETQDQVASDTTNSEGYFILDNLAYDKIYYIVVGDYEDQKIQGIAPLSSPRNSKGLQIIIRSEGKIIGVVQDKNGSYFPNVKVTLKTDQGEFVDSTNTANNGSFAFGVTPGKYYIEVSLYGCEDHRGKAFNVESNEVKHLGLITLKSVIGLLNLYLKDADGNPIKGSMTIVDAYGNQDTFLVDEFISITLCTGTYIVIADSSGFLSKEDSVMIQGGEKIYIIRLQAEPGSCVVMVRDTKGNSISKAQVFVDGEEIGDTDSDGCFRIPHIVPGVHYIAVEKLGYISSKQRIEISRKEELEIEVNLRYGPLYLRFLGFIFQYWFYIGFIAYVLNLIGNIYEYIISKRKREKFPLWKTILIILSPLGLFYPKN